MEKWLPIIVLGVLFLSCREDKGQLIYGDWHVVSRFHKATYRIANIDGKVVGKVMGYDDGTTRYHWSSDQPLYIFQDLETGNGIFVDGFSGATTQSGGNKIEIKVIHTDSLHVEFHFNDYPMSEIWTRKK